MQEVTVSTERYEELVKSEERLNLFLKVIANIKYTSDIEDVLSLFGVERKEGTNG